MHWVNWLYTIPARLRSLFMRKRQDAELDEELRDHIQRQTEDNLSRGMSEGEARLAARRTFGNFVLVREQTHESWAWTRLEQIWQDFRYALRSVRRAPLLSTVAPCPWLGHRVECRCVHPVERDVSQSSNAH